MDDKLAFRLDEPISESLMSGEDRTIVGEDRTIVGEGRTIVGEGIKSMIRNSESNQ